MRASGVYEKGSFDLLELVRELFSSSLPADVGAVTTFTGITRVLGKDAKPVSKLEMQSYELHANRILQQIAREIEAKYGVRFVGIYHLIGEFAVGEPVVFVLVAGVNRKEVFPALQEAVERYKREPALWKREVYVDGTQEWIAHA
jgi:molybdopterin synthase catalytic subunit